MSLTFDAAPPAAAPPFPDWMLDGDDVARRLAAAGLTVERARPAYLRDKPGETLVVGYELTAGAHTEHGYLRWCADAQRSADDHRKACSMAPHPSPLGPGVVAVDDHTVLRVLPNDGRLRRARWYLSPRKLKRTMTGLDPSRRQLSASATSVRLLTYRPERRIVARLDLGYADGDGMSVLVRYTTQPTAPRLATIADHLARHGVATARPLAQLEEGRVGVDEFLGGRDLHTVLAQRPDQRVVDAVAEQIAALHRVPPLPSLSVRTRDDELAAAREALDWLVVRGFADRGLAAAVGRALGAASERPSVRPLVLVHGDLHDRNVLVDGPTGAPSARLIDLERAAVGEPAIDLGCLVAAGIAGGDHDSPARIVAGIRDLGGRAATEPAALAFHTAKELVRIAVTEARRARTIPDPTLVERLLDAARGVLRDPGSTSVPGTGGPA